MNSGMKVFKQKLMSFLQPFVFRLQISFCMDGKDNSFMVVFHEGYNPQSTLPKIFVASENSARLSIFFFNHNPNNKSITFDKGNVEYTLGHSVIPNDGIHLAGVELHSDARINVYGFLDQSSASEGFLSIPKRFASVKYIIPTLPSYADPNRFKNLIAFTPVYQNTIVSINLKLESGSISYENIQYSNNDTIRMVMQKYTTFQLSHDSDLSGTLVEASKPIVAVSGNQCNYAVAKGVSVSDCQPFIELVLPTDQLDNLFITPHISTRLNNTVRIQATNSTKLTIRIGNQRSLQTLSARDSWDFYYNTISLISASNNILVMSYPHGLKGAYGDPFMMTIPGVNQYLNKYDFVVPTGFTSFISITIHSDAIDGLLVDGNSSSIASVFNISEGKNQFSSFSLPISAGIHHIEHRKQARFGLWIYGNRYSYDGYGYPAGMAYKIYN